MRLSPFVASWSSVVLLSAAIAAGSSALSCGTQCDRNPDEPPVVYRGGVTNAARGTYFSAPYDGPYLDFPPGRTYRFFHGLGGKPQMVRAWLSFAEYPGQGDSPEGFVEAAGNQATFEGATSDYVDVRNDTCSDVRIRIEASDPTGTADPGADASAAVPAGSDAGTDAAP